MTAKNVDNQNNWQKTQGAITSNIPWSHCWRQKNRMVILAQQEIPHHVDMPCSQPT